MAVNKIVFTRNAVFKILITNNDNKKEIHRIREHIGNEINILFKNETQKVSEERDLLISESLKQWSINVTKLESTFANYRRFAKKKWVFLLSN